MIIEVVEYMILTKKNIQFTVNNENSDCCFITDFINIYIHPFTSQTKNPFLYTCEQIHSPINTSFPDPLYRGYLKPERTDYAGVPSDAYFPVLIVFVQFANDPGPDCDYWPKGQAPTFLNDMVAIQKRYPINGEWWNTYSDSTEAISDFWLQQSRGHFHIVGKAYSVILDHDYIYYQSNGGIYKINDDIYEKLNALGTIDWRDYDKWQMVQEGGNTVFRYQPDGYVDMIYKIHRSHAPFVNMPAGGICYLYPSQSQGDNYLIDSVHNIYINGAVCDIGSGLTITPGHSGTEGQSDYAPYAPVDKMGLVSFLSHEHGHYLFGLYHSNYGKMSGAGAPYGDDECLSPWESIHLGYMSPIVTNFTDTLYTIGDFSSRDSSSIGQVIQVPINGDNEFFLVSSRRKVSMYDRIMWGDTAHGDPNRVINPEYGKGVYIYHIHGGYNYPAQIDQECADGLFKWQLAGYQYPDWSNTQKVPYYVRTEVSYENDRSDGSTINCADGKSIFTWFSLGKTNPYLNGDGTDKEFTNKSDVWTSREFMGDRWDAWNVGYNEIFSPYSSPSTRDWNNNNSGIFIWYKNFNATKNTCDFKIYKVGEGGLTEQDILLMTPPSRPMGLKVSFDTCVNGNKYPHLRWNHNLEPDMIHHDNTKRYNIYRAESVDANVTPSQYFTLLTVNIDANSQAEFIDSSVQVSCSSYQTNGGPAAVRYVITAIDTTGWESVKSDFAAISLVPDPIGINQNGNNIPKSYNLKQNYPNPFNPATVICYQLPKDGLVNLTVYDILGREVSVLINSFQKSGSYNVVFNGNNFASGIYFYRIKALAPSGGDFVQTKKMILIK